MSSSASTPAPPPPGSELGRLVRTPPAPRLPPALLFVASFALFLVASERRTSLTHLAILAGVLTFHEAGHALGMLALGYRDVRIFFIPFLGAATAGKPDGGPGWRHGVVLLLGPVPGVVAGALLALAAGAPRATIVGYAARTLVFVNAFNLLPVAPLDGGRLLELLLFSRHRALELFSKLLSAAAFALLAFRSKSWLLGAMAFVALALLPSGWAIATAAAALRRSGLAIPRRVEDASDELVDATDRALRPGLGGRTAATRATWLRLILTRAVDAERAPGLAGSLALLGAWAVSVALAIAAIVVCLKAR